MPDTTYTKGKIEEFFGKDILPKSTIQFYTDRNVVEPFEKPDRRGKPRKYSVENLVELLLCRKMVDLGFTIGEVRHVFHIIKQGAGSDMLDPDHFGKLVDNMTISLRVEYTTSGKVIVDTMVQVGETAEFKMSMADKIHVRIINISEILRTVQRATKGAI